jgi:hypothetical protein
MMTRSSRLLISVFLTATGCAELEPYRAPQSMVAYATIEANFPSVLDRINGDLEYYLLKSIDRRSIDRHSYGRPELDFRSIWLEQLLM